MTHLFSGRSEPRREDAAARQLIERNRDVIERLADQISNGAWSARKAAAATPAAEPQPQGLIIRHGGVPAPAEPRPYVRVSPNGRVTQVDYETNRQMRHLGEVRRVDGVWRFVLATGANGFFSPLDEEAAARLADLDGARMGAGRDDARLAEEIAERLDRVAG